MNNESNIITKEKVVIDITKINFSHLGYTQNDIIIIRAFR